MARTEAIYQLLDTVGDRSGETNAIGNYSLSTTGFKFKPIKGIALIERMIIGIEDQGSMDSGAYGNGLGLVSGIRLYLRSADDSILEEFTAFPIRTNGEWAMHCHDVTRHAWGAGNEVLSIRWTFSKAGQPIAIDHRKGEYLEVGLEDNFSNLIKHTFFIQGKYKTIPERLG